MIHWTLQPVCLCGASSSADSGTRWRKRVGCTQPQMRPVRWQLKANQPSVRRGVEAEQALSYLHTYAFEAAASVHTGSAPLNSSTHTTLTAVHTVNAELLLILFLFVQLRLWALITGGGASSRIQTANLPVIRFSTQHIFLCSPNHKMWQIPTFIYFLLLPLFVFLYFCVRGGKMFCILTAPGISVHQSRLFSEQGQHAAPAPAYLSWPVRCALLAKDNRSAADDQSWRRWSSFEWGFVCIFKRTCMRLFQWSNSCTDETVKKSSFI